MPPPSDSSLTQILCFLARRGALAAVVAIALALSSLPMLPTAEAQPGASLGKSGLPVPRFASLKAHRVNVRVGPGQNYKIAWIFTRQGLPIEVIQEFDTWRRVRDSDGSVGWIFHSLLSGERTGVVAPWGLDEPVAVLSRPQASARTVAYLESGVLGEVRLCRDDWCRISGDRFDGWVRQETIWGVYPDETFD